MFYVRSAVTLAFLILTLTQASAAPPSYTITDLGAAQPVSTAPTTPMVVGSVSSPQQTAAVLHPTLISLGTLGGGFSRANGAYGPDVVGYAALGLLTHAFRWRQSTGMLDLLTADPDDVTLFSAATDINGATTICGYGDAPGRTSIVPLVWAGGTGFPHILPTPGNQGEALALNDNGDIVGQARVANGQTHCTVWPLAGGVTDCHTAGNVLSTANAINSAGQVVGNMMTPMRGFVWLPLSGALPLPPITDHTRSEAYGINDESVIVGHSSTPGASPDTTIYAASRWVNGQGEDLNALCSNCTGWVLTKALSVNNLGLITGTGMLNNAIHAYVLTPTPQAPPSSGVVAMRLRGQALVQQLRARAESLRKTTTARPGRAKEEPLTKEDRWQELVETWQGRRDQ